MPFAFEDDSDWGRCLSQFLDAAYARSRSDATLRNYRQVLKAFLCSPPKLPDRYTRADVEAFLRTPSTSNRRLGEEVAAGTMNLRLSVLTSFYRFAATYTILGEDGELRPILARLPPTAGIARMQADESYPALRFDELTAFFAAIPTDSVLGLRDRALFLMYFWTARRRNEILGLRYGDIEEQIVIDPNGARRMAWTYHFRGKGRQHTDDVAELPAPAKEALDRYLDVSGRRATIGPDDPLFAAAWAKSGKASPLTPSAVRVRIKHYAKAAGLDPERVTTHSFRHTAARERYAAGADVRAIQHLLRHASLATTDRYLRVLTEAADPGAKLLEEKFGKL